MKRFMLIVMLTALVVAVVADSGFAKKYRADDAGWLGIYIQTIDEDLAEAFDLERDFGVIINDVVQDSPADEAGLEEGDIIISVDGRKVTRSDDLIDMIKEAGEGTEIDIIVLRDGDRRKLTAVLAEVADNRKQTFFRAPKHGGSNQWFFSDANSSYIGVRLSSLSQQLGDYFGVDKGRGALITEVEEDSPADQAGIKAGDVITAIDDEKVTDSDDVVEIVGETDPGDKITVVVVRDKSTRDIRVEVGERENDYSFGQFNRGIWRSPDIDVVIPDLSGLKRRNLHRDIDVYFDESEFEQGMSELRKEMKQLQRELKKLKKRLD